jgi:hypothetical protein
MMHGQQNIKRVNKCLEASAAACLRYALFWDVTRHIMVVKISMFLDNLWFHLQGQSSALCSNFKAILSLPSAIRFLVSSYKAAQGYPVFGSPCFQF